MRKFVLLILLFLPSISNADFPEMAEVIKYLYPKADFTYKTGNVVLEQGLKDPEPIIVKWTLVDPKPTNQFLKANLALYLADKSQADIDQNNKEDALKLKLNLSDDDIQTLLHILDRARK